MFAVNGQRVRAKFPRDAAELWLCQNAGYSGEIKVVGANSTSTYLSERGEIVFEL